MNRHTELKYQVECLQDIAVVNCSGRMVRGPALDGFRRRIEQLTEQLDRVRVLVLDVSEVEQLDAGGLGTLLLMRRWATQKSAKLKLVNPPAFFRALLETTHLNSVFEISSLKDAISILRGRECPPRFAVA
jgi:anti-anti-sigma factor